MIPEERNIVQQWLDVDDGTILLDKQCPGDFAENAAVAWSCLDSNK